MNYINDFIDSIFAFVIYWLFGWGLIIVSLIFLILCFYKFHNYRYYKRKSHYFLFSLFVVITIVLTALIFQKITHYAIDLDPNRMTKEEKSMKEQLKRDWE
ncbi:hypothetical protein BUZ62_06715 [Staphylococcus pasteuri]|uniref:hypothetical protein n=1 Tax=Staphylococcus pasteuri TaxID=45972 RepID=UPI000D356593|nr:hypothetical protein [Staphylococcus pasteuri]PTU86842.1 hypothetical protein BUZ62_06715 [Staphylococcus pasteuri]